MCQRAYSEQQMRRREIATKHAFALRVFNPCFQRVVKCGVSCLSSAGAARRLASELLVHASLLTLVYDSCSGVGFSGLQCFKQAPFHHGKRCGPLRTLQIYVAAPPRICCRPVALCRCRQA